MTSGLSGPILVTGASGQVGSELIKRLATEAPEISITAPARTEFDLLNPDSIRSAVRAAKPRWVVSCGAYTAVDAAENDRDAAYAINATAPGVLAEEAVRTGATLIHLSTDYVFDGSGTRPWLETDSPGPLGVYGASKLAGEQAIAAVGERTGLPYVILRTSWVYSSTGRNFVRTMLRLLSTRTEALRVVADQHGAPTAAADLAYAILQIFYVSEESGSLSPDNSGVYHCAAQGETTWFGFANAVREYLRMTSTINPPEIIPVSTAEYTTAAKRPRNSRLNTGKLLREFGIHMPHWTASLADVLRELSVAGKF